MRPSNYHVTLRRPLSQLYSSVSQPPSATWPGLLFNPTSLRVLVVLLLLALIPLLVSFPILQFPAEDTSSGAVGPVSGGGGVNASDEEVLELWGRVKNESSMGLALVKLLADYSVRTAHADTKVVTMATSDGTLHKYSGSLLFNIMYASSLGYAYELDRTVYATLGDDPHEKIMYNKIPLLWAHLVHSPLFVSNVVYLDTDVIIMDSIRNDFFHRIFSATPEIGSADLILADHSIAPNAGVILTRRTPWMAGFMDRWWNTSERYQGKSKWGDNGALHPTIVAHAISQTPGGEACANLTDAADVRARTAPHEHFMETMSCLGFEYGGRLGIGKIAILPQNRTEFRLNQWYFGSHLCCDEKKTWIPANFYQEGDLVAHTKFPYEVLSPQRFLARFRESSFTTQSELLRLYHILL